MGYKRFKLNIIKILIFIILLINTLFLGKGAISIPDEVRYIRSYQGLEAFIEHGDYNFFFGEIVINAGNPTYQIFSLIPSGIQYILEKTAGINHLTRHSLLIPQFFNCLVLFGIIFFLFLITKEKLTTIFAMLFSLLVLLSTFSTIYLRHLLPYDLSIFVFIIMIYQLINLKSTKFRKACFGFGVLSSLSFTIYTGYFFFSIIIYVILILELKKGFFKTTFYYTLGWLPLTILYEILGRLANTSYIHSIFNHSSTITQGDFNEGFLFPFEYIYVSEGFFGVLILFFSFLYVFKALTTKGYIANTSVIEKTLLTSILIFIIYCLQCYFLNKLVWYGRIVHFFVLIMAISSFIFIMNLKNTLKHVLIFPLFLFAGINFLNKYNSFKKIDYPRDILEINKVLIIKDESNQFSFTIPGVKPYFPFQNKDFVYRKVENCGLLWPSKENKIETNNKETKHTLLKEYEHFLNYEPYLFEGYNRNQRKALLESPIFIKILD